jgi:hypothetical protein
MASRSRRNLSPSIAADKFWLPVAPFDLTHIQFRSLETFPSLCPSINPSLQAPLGANIVSCPSYRPRQPGRLFNASSTNLCLSREQVASPSAHHFDEAALFSGGGD